MNLVDKAMQGATNAMMALGGRTIVWKPLRGAQTAALRAPFDELLLEGTRGGGKTDVQIMLFRKNVGKGYGSHHRGIIFDREYSMLGDIIKKAQRWLPLFKDGARYNSVKMRWVWPTGESLEFAYMKRDEDYDNHHGQEYSFIAWNELTKQPTSYLYEKMMSCLRSSFRPELHSPDLDNPLPELPLQVVATTNPWGAGHVWVKKWWGIGIVPPGKIQLRPTTVYNPRTDTEEVIVMRRLRLFSSYKDNVYLPLKNIADLNNQSDPNIRKAWLHGDWDIEAGGVLEGVWSPIHQVKPRFKVPEQWRNTRCMDWGSTHPFYVGICAIADGTTATYVDPATRKLVEFCPVKGSIVFCGEIYGARETGTNKGNKDSATTVAKKTLALIESLLAGKWITGKVSPGPADNQIANVTNSETLTIEDLMRAAGCSWGKSEKGKGSRKIGLQLMRQMLENAKTGEGPGLYFMNCCTVAIETLPHVPRDDKDPDDADTTSEDHAYDAIRYMCLDGAPDYVQEFEFEMLR